MSDEAGIKKFLTAQGWGEVPRAAFAADFSSRRFFRLAREQAMPARAVLMSADADQKTDAFVQIAGLLRQAGVAAPEIYGADAASGLVLMEDLGDGNIGRMIDSGADAAPLLRDAVDVLAQLHREFVADEQRTALPTLGTAYLTAQTEPFLDGYFPYVKKRAASADERASFVAAWGDVLAPVDGLPQSLMLRDYITDNLMLLAQGEGWRRIGVVDFQDGGIGPALYDLASLSDMVRRDGGETMLNEMQERYHAGQPTLSLSDVRRGCHVLAAQRHARHLRILGLAVERRDDEAWRAKLHYVPRIESYLRHLLRDEGLQPVRRWFDGQKLLS